MKPLSADGSVGSPHVRVGHCQASNKQPHPAAPVGVFYWMLYDAAPMGRVIVIRYLAKPNSSPLRGRAGAVLNALAFNQASES